MSALPAEEPWRCLMNKRALPVAVVVLLYSTSAIAQSPKSATYITDAQVKAVNALPGVDRQIVSVDIGKLNEAVEVIHRRPTNAAAAGRGAAAANPAPPAAGQSCGEQAGTAPSGSV